MDKKLNATIKVKLKWLYWFKFAICNFFKNEIWIKNFVLDIEANPNRYIKYKILKNKQ